MALMLRAWQSPVWATIADPAVLRALLTSVWIGSASASLAVALAWVLAHYQARGGVASSAWVGFLVPAQVLALSLFLAFQALGWRDPALAVIISNALMGLPFALLILTPIVTRMANTYDRLAAHLNLVGWRRLLHVEWPHQRPALLWVWVFVFGLSLGDFGVVALFGNADFATLPYLLYQKLGSYRTMMPLLWPYGCG